MNFYLIGDVMEKKKVMFALFRDGEILPDTHIFLFSDVLTAILTFYLFSVTFASKDIKLYAVGEYIQNIFHSYDDKEFICDYYDGINLVSKFRASDPDKYKHNVVTYDYIKQIMSDVDRAIELRFKSDEKGE